MEEDDVADVEDAVVDVKVGEDVIVGEVEGDVELAEDEGEEYALPL